MFNTIGRLLLQLRQERGWTQSHLATLLRVSQNLISLWERGERGFPLERVTELASIFEVKESSVRELCVPPEYFSLATEHRETLPPYPVKGSLTDLPPEWSVGLSAALRDEMEHAFPRDSWLELGAALRFLEAGKLCCVRLMDLGCRLLVVEKGTLLSAGHLWRHAVVIRGKSRTLILIPQVSLVVVAQSTERRVDFLALWVGKGVGIWAGIEIDSGWHETTANEDARRAWGLRLPRLGYTAGDIERQKFYLQVVADLKRLESKVEKKKPL